MHHAWSGSNEYGDCTDVMGCGSLGKINLPHRLFMGWQDVSSMAAVQDMTLCSGNKKIIFYLHAYNIENPIASPDGGLSNVGTLPSHRRCRCHLHFFFPPFVF